MARLRKFTSYRKLERPYTRTSKFKDKSFIRITPNVLIAKFETGNLKKKFPFTANLVSKNDLQIRDNAIESARMTTNRLLERTLGLTGFKMKLRIYPFHVLRENPIAAGAGADRFSTGMQKSFGKPIGSAARVKKGQIIFEVGVEKNGLDTARQALKRALKKLPCSCIIDVKENK
ncbi:50S ribosomal protein L16 [candidate division LCP-89 bacterium B3_LCP]|uniref:50S ribosomal protein L16 n=1 Tax=candidate division LCP-89 bacterium B3_LCP TaxID=2012998 RepID=A0A532UZ29_UNCL8|nr:MAG: 50S ribosomal protein L16 [candidate division LCP-89 bacterium B3_LCP]